MGLESLDFVLGIVVVGPLMWLVLRYRRSLYPAFVGDVQTANCSQEELGEFIRARRVVHWGIFFVLMHVHSTYVIYESFEGGSHPMIYLGVNVAHVVLGTLFLTLWRFGVMSTAHAGVLLSSLFFCFTVVASLMSGRVLFEFVTSIISVPIISIFIIIWTDSWFSGISFWLAIFVLALLSHLNPIQEPWFCVECLREQVKYLQFAACMCISAMYHQIVIDRRLYEEALHTSSLVKEQFFSTVSHELKTPLNGIIGTLAMSDDRWSDAVKRREDVGTIRLCSQVLLLLIENVLLHGSFEPAKLSYHPVRVKDFFGNAVKVISALLPQDGDAHVELFADPRVPEVLPLCKELLQAVLNLGSNGVKYGEGRPIRIEVDLVGDLLAVKVIDLGKGVPEDLIPHLFQPYTRANTLITGTGLGLHISKKLCRAMGGDVVYRRSGETSVFTITVSINHQNAGCLRPLETSLLAPRPHADDRYEKRSQDSPAVAVISEIVVVEDNAVNRKVFLSYLRKLGVERVSCFDDGREALKYFLDTKDEASSQLVLLDINLPHLSGTTVARALKVVCDKPPVLIAISAGGSHDKSLFDANLSKPLKFETLKNVLASYQIL